MPRLLALFAGGTAAVVLLSAGAQPDRVRPVASNPVVDSVAGDWFARGKDPRWHGRFLLQLTLEQSGDSVWGTYTFTVDRRTVVPPDDIYGSIRAGKLELQDRHQLFWLGVNMRKNRLAGRLAGGARDRSDAATILFTRDRPR